jgi:hypothetical protein
MLQPVCEHAKAGSAAAVNAQLRRRVDPNVE